MVKEPEKSKTNDKKYPSAACSIGQHSACRQHSCGCYCHDRNNK